MTQTMESPVRQIAGRAVPTAGRWQIDGAHTSVEFVARHLMVTKVRGAFADVSGTIEVGDDPLESRVTVALQTNSITTGDESRDAHLRSQDFFDVERHPEMTFSSTKVRADGDAWILDGDLTIKGVTRPVSLDVAFLGTVEDPWGNTKAAFSATTEIEREDWGLTWNVALDSGGLLVSKKISIEIELQASPMA